MTSVPNSNVEIKEECDEHHCSYMVSPGAYNMRTVLDFNTVYLPAGTEIEVSAPFGIQGEVEFLISKNISDNEIIPSETLY